MNQKKKNTHIELQREKVLEIQKKYKRHLELGQRSNIIMVTGIPETKKRKTR